MQGAKRKEDISELFGDEAMILTILTHITAVVVLGVVGIALTGVPIFLYNTSMKKNEKFGKIMGWLIFAGILCCLPAVYYIYLNIRYDVGSFSDTDILYLAAENGNVKAAQNLIEKGASPDGGNRYGRTAVYRAVMLDDSEMLRLFLESGANPNGAEDMTLLDLACKNQCNENVSLLLSAGADPDYRPDLFVPALHYAAMYDEDFNADLVELLVSHGADPASSAYRENKEMLPFRYYFDEYVAKEETLDYEERQRYERIEELLYRPYIEWLKVKMESENKGEQEYDRAVS
ncbi:MAG: ankyrin repeat domain-containing protein [Oscillospiraceae bacterium]|nr:ankyrin repeat domain-containing protein [Oscillospiraceae bacterium]